MSDSGAPAVSVVIPAYNAAAFIVKTLDSVRSQVYRDFEVIVVDDGSKDGTAEAVENHLKRYQMNGRCIRQENKKIAAARNAGLRAALGTYIALLDHDDLWYPNKLSLVMREFQIHPDADLISHHENITRGGRLVEVKRYGPAASDMYERLLFGGNALSPSASVFRKAKALEIGGFRENPEFNTVEDYDFWMRLSRVSKFHFMDQVLGECQLVERAASRGVEYHHTNTEAMLRDHFRSYFGERPGWRDRLRMRRRLSAVYRSALGLLLQYDELPELRRQYAVKMLRAFPWDPKNIYRSLAWMTRAARRSRNGK